MYKRIILSVLRIIISITVLTAVVVQYQHGLDMNPNFNVVNFFSFFTIQSNILAALVMLIAAGFLLANKWSARLDSLRGATTLYMAITGVTYFLLLRGIEDQLQTPIPWVNIVLHYAFPILILLDWFMTPLARKVLRSSAFTWLIFPLAYVIYSMIRGYFILWYPYPFLSPMEDGGYLKVFVMSLFIALIGLGVAFILIRNKNVIASRQKSA